VYESGRPTALFDATGLKHDVLLLHANSDDADRLGRVIRRKLTERSIPPYDVFDYSGDDLLPGQSTLQQSLSLSSPSASSSFNLPK